MINNPSPQLTEQQINILRLEYFNKSNDAVYVFDFEDGLILDANDYVCNMLGYTREELLQITVFDIHPEEEHDRMIELIELFAQEGQIRGVSDMHLKKKDGTWIPVEKNGTLFPINGRKVVQCTCRDISMRKKFEAELNKRIEDMHILNTVALEITSGLELETLLPRITQSVVKLLNADAGMIGLYDARKGSLKYRYLYNMPDNIAGLEIPRGAGLTGFVLESKHSVSIPDYQSYPKSLKEFREASVRATAITPLLIENRLLGTLMVMHLIPEKKFNEYDMGLLESVARQAAIAIYNAQLFEEMKEEGDFRQALGQLTSLIGSALDINKVYDLICKEGTRLFKSSGTYLYALDTNKEMLIGKMAYGEKAEEFLKIALPINEPSLATYIYHTRKPVLIDNVEISPLIKAEVNKKFKSKTLMGVPIIVDGEVKSVLVFASNERSFFFSETQLDRAKILSDQVAFAIKNAALYEQTRKALEHERYVAITLQQSLLPEKVPQVEGTEIGAYYAPTQAGGSLVGGDFYDFVQLPDGRVVIVIGDVSGKGIEAAATTAMVKYAIRSFIYRNPAPFYVMTQANKVVSMQLKSGLFVSLCYILYEPKTGKIELANAGHPYPIHFSADKKACKLIETNNPVFGLISDFEYTQVEKKLAEGDILALYTDGLIEARLDHDFFGADRAKESVCKNYNKNAQNIIVDLVRDSEKFAKGNLTDDVAIIVLKRH
ncbi:MAG: SpoIIE family protein phosphatase [Firmicutes bacterium]|nr:SpoIIE family protein phosphatase [Bacillota bacterium]